MYCYFCVKTDCLTNTWDTAEIRQFLNSLGIFTENYAGHFRCQSPFISLSLMKVKNVNSWSGEDLFHKLELFLGWRVCADDGWI